jgi:hypothetical protein
MHYLVKPYIQLKTKFNDRASYISIWMRATYIQSALTVFTHGNIFQETRAPIITYFAIQNHRDLDDAREIFVRNRVCFYLINKACLPLKQYICIQFDLSF